MTTTKQRRAARQNIKKAQQRWQEMTHAERVLARPKKLDTKKLPPRYHTQNRNT